MTTIQIILTVGILFSGVYAYKKLRSSYLDAFFIFMIVSTGLFFTFFPGLSNRVAHFLGVGRGADMIFYLSILFFAFLILKLYAKIRKMEQRFTQLIREESLRRAEERNSQLS